jgi:hypothetical protein
MLAAQPPQGTGAPFGGVSGFGVVAGAPLFGGILGFAVCDPLLFVLLQPATARTAAATKRTSFFISLASGGWRSGASCSH